MSNTNTVTVFATPAPVNDDSDEDEAQERHEHDIEEAVREFVDELPIRHDEIPECEPYIEGEETVFKNQRTSETEDIRRGSGNLYQGQVFINGVSFKEVVLDHALRTGRNIKQYRYDKTKIGFSCVGKGCEWKVYASIPGSSENWEIKLHNSVHSCVPNGQCEMMKVPVIATLFLDKIRDEPDYFMPMKIEELVMEKWKISVSRHQCQAARKKALRLIETEYDNQFQRLRDYKAEILLSNPGSSVEIETMVNENGLDVFDRFYVCFDCLRRSWKETCRPLIGVDGCFMRGKMKGQILVVLGRDGNNGIYPLAWAVVQVENKPNWLWFVKKLREDLALGTGDGYVLISDRQKGLISAVQLELPSIEHRMCVRHIYGNLKALHGKKSEMKLLIWNLAWSYNETYFNENLDRIFCYDLGVYNDVMKSKPRTWCRAFYKIGSNCEDVENNSSESFNNTIKQAREKPLVPMLETITRLAMVRIAKREAKANAHKGICTPYAQRYLADEHDVASECQVHSSTNNNFQVLHRGCAYRVSLDRRTCTCKKWDISGIPCEHAYGVILKMKLEVEDYVSHWFRTAVWRRTYVDGLTPLRGARFWPTMREGVIHEPPEPPQPGRKKITKKAKRKKGINESPTKKQTNVKKRVMTCKVCGGKGHNSRHHKSASQSQSSLVESSQGVVTQDH